MYIAFCINKLGMVGLGATVSSLIQNCSASQKLKLYFLCNHLEITDKYQIEMLLQKENFLGKFTCIDINPDLVFKGLRSLHGDFTTYGRLLLVDLIPENQILYLDSDLLVEVDVLDVDDFDFQDKVLAAVDAGTIRYALENDFYVNKLGISPDTSSFNAGVLLFNLKEWRAQNLKKKCLELGYNYPNELLSCDQSILNGLFAGKFAKLPQNFNCSWYATDDKPNIFNKAVFHFVGSPKPWDFFGNFLHKGFVEWRKYTRPEWLSSYRRFTSIEIIRIWRIRKSYIRSIIKLF